MTTSKGLKIKYNRVSTLQQSGSRFELDEAKYDVVLFDKISGTVPFNERPKAKKLINLVESGKVSEITIEEFSRLGRNTGDCIRTLEWLEQMEINVIVRNLGLQSRPNGKKNPIWGMISATLSSVYTMELENIRERTDAGRKIYLQNGGQLGRPLGSNESEKEFFDKPKSKEILKLINKGRTAREIAAILACSTKTVQKVRLIGGKFGAI
jgi:DNA invertase Pin-like site-specific DNA recombinase